MLHIGLCNINSWNHGIIQIFLRNLTIPLFYFLYLKYIVNVMLCSYAFPDNVQTLFCNLLMMLNGNINVQQTMSSNAMTINCHDGALFKMVKRSAIIKNRNIQSINDHNFNTISIMRAPKNVQYHANKKFPVF
ncbi:hypothetical protein O6H91_22G029200 [Diphasiastrum complanatum]|uniref:Uncharacterized protein n=1 Tax=Diphasiastrum complanatum TaxID=34168 RepID=A0ACC2AE15_DIPCM|nr:hypothetical protein O6H91_22G029200 [Diphasiastrum complanatum]